MTWRMAARQAAGAFTHGHRVRFRAPLLTLAATGMMRSFFSKGSGSSVSFVSFISFVLFILDR